MDRHYFEQVFHPDPLLWKPMVMDLCQEQGLPLDVFEPFLNGSNLAAAVGGDCVIKIFPSWLRHQWTSEVLVLRHLHSRLSLPTPRCLGAGEQEDGFTWLLMSRLPGTTLDRLWSRMSLENKANVLLRVGHLMAEVRQLPVEGLEALRPRWDEFLPMQLAGYKSRHEKQRMPGWFLNEVEAYVQQNLPLLPRHFQPILLTGEYTPFNLMATVRAGNVELSGMIDFGDAMVGYAEYDLLGPSLFLGEGHPLLIRSLFQGYGEAPRPPALLLLQILHRFSNFSAQLSVKDWQERVHSISELERLIWPVQIGDSPG